MKKYTLMVASCVGAASFLCEAATALAGNITAQGNVTALTDRNQMGPVEGTATYDEGPVNANVPLGTYTPQGMTFFTGKLTAILPGVTTPGDAVSPFYQSDVQYFPQPIGGNGVQAANYAYFGGAAKFTADTTQVGLTASRNGNQFLTVWDKAGKMLGQINWAPAGDAAFIGVDTKGVPIGMVTYGNDDLWNGGTYNVGGNTIMSDTWVWGPKPECVQDSDCDDKDLCTGAETCVANKCVAGVPLECVDDNGCTDDTCDAALGCVFANNVAPCDDADACTVDTLCAEGVCGGGGAVDCADDNACTMDACDPIGGCSNEAIADCCLVDADCQPAEACVANACSPIDGTTGTTDASSTGGSSTDGSSTDGSSTGGSSTGGSSSGDVGTSSGGSTDAPGTGGTGGEGLTTGSDDTGPSPTTGGVPGTTGGAGTTGGTGTDSDTAGASDDGGCGCRSRQAGDSTLGALAALGLGLLLLRRRRRAA